MFKAVKVILLVAILVGAGVGIYALSRPAKKDTGGTPQLQADESKKPRVEEKYGFTSDSGE